MICPLKDWIVDNIHISQHQIFVYSAATESCSKSFSNSICYAKIIVNKQSLLFCRRHLTFRYVGRNLSSFVLWSIIAALKMSGNYNQMHKRTINTFGGFGRGQDEDVEPNADDGVDSPHSDSMHTASRPHYRRISSTTKPLLTSSPMPDSLDKFFTGIADTMRTFPKHEIAKIKLNISTLVGQAEVKLSRPEQDPLPMVYIPAANNSAAADISNRNIHGLANENRTIGANTVLIITKNEANEIVHDLTMDDWNIDDTEDEWKRIDKVCAWTENWDSNKFCCRSNIKINGWKCFF